jgi:hypothetical protein
MDYHKITVNVTTGTDITREQAINQGRSIASQMRAQLRKPYGGEGLPQFTTQCVPADDYQMVTQYGVVDYVTGPVSAMRMTPHNGYMGFTVLDADGSEIKNVVWVDDAAQQYACYEDPPRLAGLEFALIVTSVNGIRVDHAYKKIYVNTGVVSKVPSWTAVPAVPVVKQKPRACSECRQEETCRRISYCAAFKCGFGEDDAP